MGGATWRAVAIYPGDAEVASPYWTFTVREPYLADAFGHVTDSVTGDPVEGASVSLEPWPSPAATQANGWYGFGHVEIDGPSVESLMTVTATGYAMWQETVTVYDHFDYGTNEIDVALVPVP